MLSCDPAVECWKSGAHAETVVGTGLCVAPLLFGFPYYMYTMIRDSVVYSQRVDHEKRMQIDELLYMLNVSNEWLTSQLWMSASFVRGSVYTRVEWLVIKGLALFAFVFCRSDLVLQALLFWVIYVGFFVRLCWSLPYRVMSTNLVLFVLSGAMIVNVTYGLMNALGAQSAVMVASIQTITLLAANGLATVLIVVIVVFTRLNPFLAWPSEMTLRRLNSSSRHMRRHYRRWVQGLREYHAFRRDWWCQARSNVDIRGLEAMVYQLRRQWLVARSQASLFETPLSDAIEDLLILRSYWPADHRTLRTLDAWDAWHAPQETGPAVSAVVGRRKHALLLMNDKKRSMLTKLLALRAFIGDRSLAHYKFLTPEEEREALLREQLDREQRDAAIQTMKTHVFELTERTNRELQAYRARQHGEDREAVGSMSLMNERDELIGLLEEWNDVLALYERHAMPGAAPPGSGSDSPAPPTDTTPVFSNEDVEEWYSYRLLLGNRLDSLREEMRPHNDLASELGRRMSAMMSPITERNTTTTSASLSQEAAETADMVFPTTELLPTTEDNASVAEEWGQEEEEEDAEADDGGEQP